jgi:hypothetical protein
MVLGIILLIISLMTIWSMFVNFNLSNALFITLSIPLFIFSISSIIYALILMTKERLNVKVKGILMITNGIISILAAVYTMLDFRLSGLGFINIIVLVPMVLIGIFFIIDGLVLYAREKHLRRNKSKKKLSQILGLLSILIGIINLIAFIILIIIVPDQPILLSGFWIIIGLILIIFGIKSIIKKIEKP